MKRAGIFLFVLMTAGCLWPARDSFRPRGLYNNALHRFFPDLERRENAIFYGRWRALELAWVEGISAERDAIFAHRLRAEVLALPDFPPDPDVTAPRFGREAPAAAGAILAAGALEREVADALAAADATPALTQKRIGHALLHYQRSRWALGVESERAQGPVLANYSTAKLLLAGDWLLAKSAEDLAVSNYGEQRWRIRATVEEYDRTIAALPASIPTSWYRQFAPTFTRDYPAAAQALDRATLFRGEIFQALAAPDLAGRRRGVREVEKIFGLSS